jgi:nicotinate-nucleotide pyrophosphorylase (carboxylating)
MLNLAAVKRIVTRALAEDIGSGDITTALTVPPSSVSRAHIVSRESGVIAGMPVAEMVFRQVAKVYGSEKPEFHIRAFDGCPVAPGQVAAEIVGPTAVILTGERTALNFLQRMSGIAAKTAHMVDLVKGTNAKIVDTRKTTPGLRVLEKYAVRMGGGQNHRFGLYDAVLIKDNHIKAAGGIKEAIEAAKAGAPHAVQIEVEAETIEQVREALESGVDMILLDNMTPATLREAVGLCKGRALTEASGGVTEENVREIAETGVDLISIGALTHSVKALDLSLEIV